MLGIPATKTREHILENFPDLEFRWIPDLGTGLTHREKGHTLLSGVGVMVINTLEPVYIRSLVGSAGVVPLEDVDDPDFIPKVRSAHRYITHTLEWADAEGVDVWMIMGVELNPKLRGQGLGKAMYLEMLNGVYPAYIAPDYIRGSSDDAWKIWESLRRDPAVEVLNIFEDSRLRPKIPYVARFSY
jgi:hypothetical protein